MLLKIRQNKCENTISTFSFRYERFGDPLTCMQQTPMTRRISLYQENFWIIREGWHRSMFKPGTNEPCRPDLLHGIRAH